MTQDELKALVGRAALDFVVPGSVVGVGTGSTVNCFIDALATMCQAGVASALVRLGIYDCDDDLQPTSLVLDAGTVDFSTTGFKSITGLSQTLDRGVYLLAAAYSHNGGGQHLHRRHHGGSGHSAQRRRHGGESLRCEWQHDHREERCHARP